MQQRLDGHDLHRPKRVLPGEREAVAQPATRSVDEPMRLPPGNAPQAPALLFPASTTPWRTPPATLPWAIGPSDRWFGGALPPTSRPRSVISWTSATWMAGVSVKQCKEFRLPKQRERRPVQRCLRDGVRTGRNGGGPDGAAHWGAACPRGFLTDRKLTSCPPRSSQRFIRSDPRLFRRVSGSTVCATATPSWHRCRL